MCRTTLSRAYSSTASTAIHCGPITIREHRRPPHAEIIRGYVSLKGPRQNGCTNSPERSFGSNGVTAPAPENTHRIPLQAVDSSAPARDTESHGEASIAPGRKAWTAGGLLPVDHPTLPCLTADLFIQAGCIVAERAAQENATKSRVEESLRRAVHQAAAIHGETA